MRSLLFAPLLCVFVLVAARGKLSAQCAVGRIFSRTPETVGIWEFNGLPRSPGEIVPTGTVIADFSGNALDAAVVANNANSLAVGRGDSNFDDPPNDPDPAVFNTTVARQSEVASARVSVLNDRDSFEMPPDQDFSLELYVHREPTPGPASWGILAGTWHSRTLIDDSQNPDANGAWYGYGFIQRGGQPGWLWVCSPVNEDGTLIQQSFNEVRNDASWEIPPGDSYIVASVNRSDDPVDGQRVRVYLNGQQVEEIGLQPQWAFITPNGYEHAELTFLTGADDRSRNAYRTAPSGYAIDAARFQLRALTAVEVEDNFLNISDGVAAPATGDVLQAVVSASSSDVVIGQCVRLSAEGSCAGAGRTITSYEYRIGGGPFVMDGPEHEVSFDTPNAPQGVDVTLRVTNDLGATATAGTRVVVRALAPVALIQALSGGRVVAGDPLKVRVGGAIELSGSGSFTPVPQGALVCPLANGQELVPPPIAEYRWDLDGDGDIDSQSETVGLGPLNTVGNVIVRLTVRTAAGAEASASRQVSVVDPGANDRVFHNTDETLLHIEFNELAVLGPVEGVGDVATVADLSDNGLEMTIVDPAGQSFVVADESPQFAAGRSLIQAGGGDGPRGEIRDDRDLFEMGPEQDFTFEIYLRASENTTPQWGDVAGTFRARTDGSDGSPRYGWGIIKSHIDLPGRPGYAWFTPNQSPNEVPVFFHCEASAFNYVACAVDRAAQTSTVYVNGARASFRVDIDPTWDFRTPPGFPHARFYAFTREQVDGAFFNNPVGTEITALRLQSAALAPQQVLENWQNICAGLGANPPPVIPKVLFRRGDADGNRQLELTDAVRILNFLFLGTGTLSCREAANSDDNRALELTDAIRVLNFLFIGGPPPAAPGHMVCGPDPEDSLSDLGCEDYNC